MAQSASARTDPTFGLTPAADELQHHLAPMRPHAVLCEINPLPGAKREPAISHRHLQRDTIDHGLHVRRHVVGPFSVVDPTYVRGRNAIERGNEIDLHVGICIFLDHK